MNVLNMISKIAGKLDRLGYIEEASELDQILIAAVEARKLTKKAAGAQIAVSVQEDAANNQWLASLNVQQGGQTIVQNLEQVSSPIFQTEELKAAANKAPGIEEMKKQLKTHLASLGQRFPQYAHSPVVILDPRFK